MRSRDEGSGLYIGKKKLRALPTILKATYIRYYLLNGLKGASYVQSLTNGQPNSSVCPVWSLVCTHNMLEAYA
jgi:hypothetical protein